MLKGSFAKELIQGIVAAYGLFGKQLFELKAFAHRNTRNWFLYIDISAILYRKLV